MWKKIIIGIVIAICVIGVIALWIYGNSESENQEKLNNQTIDELYMNTVAQDENTEVEEVKELPQDIERKKAYYDENGFVTDNLYIDCQIYNNYENDNIKAVVDSRIEEIKTKILSEPPNTSGMVVINLSANTYFYEGVNVLLYTENYRRYKMLKTYFDETFSKEIMREDNKEENSNIFKVDIENNKNISSENEDTPIYYSVKTGQKIQGISDLFSSGYDYAGEIKERVKYMLDLNVGYSENEVIKKVDDAYGKLMINIDLINQKLIISLDESGFEMFFDEFDKTQMTIF